jgi:hypothetical protein
MAIKQPLWFSLCCVRILSELPSYSYFMFCYPEEGTVSNMVIFNFWYHFFYQLLGLNLVEAKWL